MKLARGRLQSSVLAAPSVVAIALASLFSDLGHETATTLLPGFLTVILAAPPIALGLIEGVSDGVAAAAKLGGGALAAKGGALRGWTAAGYVTTGLATGLIALVPSWPWLVAIRPIGWAGRGWRGPLRNLLLTLSVPKGQFGRAFGLERAADNAGAVVAPITAILLLASIHYRAAFLVAAVPGLLAASCYLFVRSSRASRGTFDLRLSGYPPAFIRVITATAVFGSAQFAGSLFTLRATQLLVPRFGAGVGATLAIAGYFLYNLTATSVSYPIGAIADRGGPRRPRLLVLSFLSFAAGSAFLALSSISVFALIAAFLFGGAAAGAVEVAESALVGDQLPPNQRGAGFGVLAAVNGAGDFAASIWVTLVWTIFSAAPAFLAASGLAAVGAVIGARIPAESPPPLAATPHRSP
ncbi:MAG: MFS transporter [Candidatus Dormibacteraeota bacterium]|nr:MFS transporter [Candidatus Dormibacteraeota bacterium]